MNVVHGGSMENENWTDKFFVSLAVHMNVVCDGSMEIEDWTDDFFAPTCNKYECGIWWLNGN